MYRSRVIGVNTTSRSSRLKVFCRKKVPSNSAKRPEKHLCQSYFLNKVAGLRSATLLKKRLWHACFPVYFAKFLRKSFLTEHLLRMLLNVKASKLTFLSSLSTSFRTWLEKFNPQRLDRLLFLLLKEKRDDLRMTWGIFGRSIISIASFNTFLFIL